MAVYVTVVIPSLKVSPLAWVEVNEVTPQLSEASGSAAGASGQVTTAVDNPASVNTVKSAGTFEMTGASSSVTVTVKELVAVLPARSVTV
jgi:hypothetical protein